MVNKIREITRTSRYHTTAVRYHAWLLILALLLPLHTAQNDRLRRNTLTERSFSAKVRQFTIVCKDWLGGTRSFLCHWLVESRFFFILGINNGIRIWLPCLGFMMQCKCSAWPIRMYCSQHLWKFLPQRRTLLFCLSPLFVAEWLIYDFIQNFLFSIGLPPIHRWSINTRRILLSGFMY